VPPNLSAMAPAWWSLLRRRSLDLDHRRRNVFDVAVETAPMHEHGCFQSRRSGSRIAAKSSFYACLLLQDRPSHAELTSSSARQMLVSPELIQYAWWQARRTARPELSLGLLPHTRWRHCRPGMWLSKPLCGLSVMCSSKRTAPIAENHSPVFSHAVSTSNVTVARLIRRIAWTVTRDAPRLGRRNLRASPPSESRKPRLHSSPRLGTRMRLRPLR
jgi:hypothetical protein